MLLSSYHFYVFFIIPIYIPNIFVVSKLIKRRGLMTEINIKFIKYFKNSTVSFQQYISLSKVFIKSSYFTNVQSIIITLQIQSTKWKFHEL